MAIQTEVLSPKSSAIYIDHLKEGVISWKAREGQTHFEIQYRQKGSPSWATLGKISSETTSYPLVHLYKTIPKEFVEIYYRLVIYYDIISGENRDSGYEYSDVYHLVFIPTSTEEIEETFGGEVDLIPLYDDIKPTVLPIVNVCIDKETKKFPLVEKDHPMAGKKQIALHGKIMCPATNQFREYNTGMYGTGVWDAQHTDYIPIYGTYYTTQYAYAIDTRYKTYQYNAPRVVSYKTSPHYRREAYTYFYSYTQYRSYSGYTGYVHVYTNRAGAPLIFDFYQYKTIMGRYYRYGVYQYSYTIKEHIYYAKNYMETFYAYINYRYSGTIADGTVSGYTTGERNICDYYYNTPSAYAHYLAQKTETYYNIRQYITGYSKHEAVSGYAINQYQYRYYT